MIRQIRHQLEAASAQDLVEVEAFVSSLVQSKAVEVALEKRAEAIEHCPVCGSVSVQRWGYSKSRTPRHRCRDCRKTFSTTTGTPFFRLRKRREWTRYLKLMNRHIPLRLLRDDFGFDQHISTLHRWRLRFLAPLTAEPSEQLAGMVEADEKFFRTSYKGNRGFRRGEPPQARKARRRGVAGARGLGAEQVPTLTAMDRSGAIRQARMPDMKWATFESMIVPWVEPDSLICSDGNQAYQRVAKAAQCEHMVAKTGGANTGGLSIGRIDAYHRDVENLVNRRCMGVATRYLMNYFGWARRITQHRAFGTDLMGEMLAS